MYTRFFNTKTRHPLPREGQRYLALSLPSLARRTRQLEVKSRPSLEHESGTGVSPAQSRWLLQTRFMSPRLDRQSSRGDLPGFGAIWAGPFHEPQCRAGVSPASVGNADGTEPLALARSLGRRDPSSPSSVAGLLRRTGVAALRRWTPALRWARGTAAPGPVTVASSARPPSVLEE